MTGNYVRTISAVLAIALLFLTACNANDITPSIEEEPPPLASLEQYTPSQDEYDYTLLPNDEEVEDIVEEPGETSLEEFVAYYIERFNRNIAGVALTVFTKDDVIFEVEYGYANIAAGLPIDSDTVFAWGSITKLLVYISAMQLYERGELDFHADILTYLGEEFSVNMVYPVTMYHLIHHTAPFFVRGTHPHNSIVHLGEPIPTLGEFLIDSFTSEYMTQLTQPGEQTAYSNIGIALAGYVVERISGVPFYKYVHNNIFAPLGMLRTALLPDSSDNDWVSTQRERVRAYSGARIEWPVQHQVVDYPAGAAVGTISDMISFAQALMLDEHGASILFESQETALMLYPSVEDILNAPKDAYVGSFFNGFLVSLSSEFDRIMGHSGGIPGFVSILLINIDRGVGIVISENTDNGLKLSTEFMDGLLDIVFG
jgi:CubicO group peptidase (beta-lactamase class C family)